MSGTGEDALARLALPMLSAAGLGRRHGCLRRPAEDDREATDERSVGSRSGADWKGSKGAAMAAHAGENANGGRNVTKKELADRVHDRMEDQLRPCKVNRQMVRNLLQAYLEEIISALARGERIELRDFGVIETKIRAPRRGRNPLTMTAVEVPSRRSVKFKPGRLMRELVEIDIPRDEEEAARVLAEAAARVEPKPKRARSGPRKHMPTPAVPRAAAAHADGVPTVEVRTAIANAQLAPGSTGRNTASSPASRPAADAAGLVAPARPASTKRSAPAAAAAATEASRPSPVVKGVKGGGSRSSGVGQSAASGGAAAGQPRGRQASATPRTASGASAGRGEAANDGASSADGVDRRATLPRSIPEEVKTSRVSSPEPPGLRLPDGLTPDPGDDVMPIRARKAASPTPARG